SPRLATGGRAHRPRRPSARPSRPARPRWPPRSPGGAAPGEGAGAGRAVEPVSPPRPPDPCSLATLVGLAPERVQDQVPGADVLDLAATEAGLEVGDPTGREAPQVVARGARPARA